MRLLNTKTLRLEPPCSSPIYPYAILSHTWGEDEVLFADICDPQKPLPVSKKWFLKVSDSCEQARQDGYEYIWIDTCCIDKTSSVELSEAINSMFRWYHDADRCYAYLSDVNVPEGSSVAFEKSRWFNRGWTLQELIAPKDVRFYDSQWFYLGSRQLLPGTREVADLADSISKTTSIPVEILRWFSPKSATPRARRRGRMAGLNKHEPTYKLDSYLGACSTGQIMSWAAYRFTTRKEDEAYSLLGLFGVNMPMLYGEGRHAFQRLQQEILKTSSDQSILAFDRPFYSDSRHLLADSPKCFASSEIVQSLKDGPIFSVSTSSFDLLPSPKAVEAGVLLWPLIRQGKEDKTRYLAILNCIYRSDLTSHPAIVLRKEHPHNDKSRTFYRTPGSGLHRITPIDQQGWIEWATVGDGLSNRLRYDLNNVYMDTIRLYFEPPHRFSDSLSDIAKLASLYTIGMRIKLDIPETVKYSYAAYPHTLQVKENRIYAPSIERSSWPKRFLGEQNPETNHLALFGTIILQFDGLGAVALSWGKVCMPERGDFSPEPWCAMMDWAKVVTAAHGQELQTFELDSSALQTTADFLCSTDSWFWVPLLASKPDTRAEYDTPRMKVRCKMHTVDFFGDPLFELELAVVPNGKSSFVDMVRLSFS
ncbi:heterokaryon incompatibility protein-domain-containing protein [Apiosordaria backusii]|uniref:Heterokaryon incompatibility protein-domain-containing protein n=1 Tax=Apiosordaria backusii TaxID=314023 RepID=A0AA40EFD6_9PEZI|nr:heterokaryon incompatibility protein-domain-containing protein [Apiosordaria backusii]